VAFEGVKPVRSDSGEKFELHWGGKVETYDNRGEAERELLKRMQLAAGREQPAPEIRSEES
jgi:hypothetical protein